MYERNTLQKTPARVNLRVFLRFLKTTMRDKRVEALSNYHTGNME
jgi:hypothetical protein